MSRRRRRTGLLPPIRDGWLGVHFAQPVLSLGVAAILWTLLSGRVGTAATVARVALPVWLVSFAVFDSVTGLGGGLLSFHAGAVAAVGLVAFAVAFFLADREGLFPGSRRSLAA